MSDAFLPASYRVAEVRREDAETSTLTLEPRRGEIPPSAAGQFNMLYAFGVGEIAVSLSGDPQERRRLVHTIRAVGAASRALARLEAGAEIGVRGPFGTSWPLEAAAGKDVVIVAGGLGLAPLRPAIYRLFAERERYGRVAIVVGMRDPAHILYYDELEAWRARGDAEVAITVDTADAAWTGHVGVVTTLIPRLAFDPQRTLAMVCGPEIMMRFSVTALAHAGMRSADIYLSMERNMKCAVGFCGHCQFGPHFVCRDGPVFRYDRIAGILAVREI